jgi:thioredoxin reductase
MEVIMSEHPELPIAVIGAGPVGLAAAAHLAERRIPFVVFEVGDDVAASVREWAHVQLFSPWSYDIDGAARRLLEQSGWQAPAGDTHPTGGELIDRYLAPLALLPEIATGLRTNRLVVGVTREGVDKVRTDGRDEAPFVVITESPFGRERTTVRAVIDASGTFLQPNPLGADGMSADGEMPANKWISYGIPDVLGVDRQRYRGRRVAVVGSGHSAQNVVRDLAQLARQRDGAVITWIVRREDPSRVFGGKADDQLPERGRLGSDAEALVASGAVEMHAGFRSTRVLRRDDAVWLRSDDGRVAGPFDQIVVATGFRPDLTFLRELRIDVDSALESTRALAPLIDPNVHSCGSVPPHGASELAQPERGLYLVGAKSYGRAPTFLLATGYEQVRSVVAEIAGDHAAARDVRLELPETGVCSLSANDVAPASAGCC